MNVDEENVDEELEEQEEDKSILYLNQSTSIFTAFIYFVSTFGAVFLRLFQIGAVIISWFWFLVSISPYLLLAGFITASTIPYVLYQDIIIEEVDFFARCRLEPYYTTGPRELLLFIQLIYSPTICWYNAWSWVPYAIVSKVLVPLFQTCGFIQTFIRLFQFLFIFLVDFWLDYILFVGFLQNDFDYTPTVVAWQAFWTSWQQGIFCMCLDLEQFFAASWIITVIPPVLPIPAQIFIGYPYSLITSAAPLYNIFLGPVVGLLGSNQLGDADFLGGWWSAFNGAMNVVQQVWRIILAVLTGQFTSAFPRPDFTQATNNFCKATTLLVRSMERANQAFFDAFLPFLRLNWNGMLSMYDTGLCVVFKLVNIVTMVLFNLDKVIAYPNNPYYDAVIVPEVIMTLNMLAPLTYLSPINASTTYPIAYVSWNWPTTSSLIPGTLLPNPVYNTSRVSDNVCLYYNRLLCDPLGNATTCASILGVFNPCCMSTQTLIGIADILAFIFDIMRHLYSLYAVTTFLNNQYVTTALAYDATNWFACLFSVFDPIPTIGPCVSTLFTQTFQAVALLIDWGIRALVGLAFLAYYITQNVSSFLTARGYALASLLSIVNSVTNSSVPNSTSSCGTFALNTAFAFPPVGCTNCQVQTNFSLSSKRAQGQTFRAWSMLDKNREQMSPVTIEHKMHLLNHRIRDALEGRFQSTCVPPDNLFTTSNPLTVPPGQNFSLPKSATNPPVALTCSDPEPACFDVACSFRALLNVIYKVIFLLGNMLNTLMQDWDIGFPFFVDGTVPKCSWMCPTVNTSASCSEACPGVNYSFEQAAVDVITSLTSVATCFCNAFNEVLPVTGANNTSTNATIYTCRPDVCCAVTRTGDLWAGMAVIAIRGIKSLTIGNVPSTPGGPNFPYFTTGPFLNDIDSIFELAFDLVLCIGNIVRSVFVVLNLGAYDLYCMFQNSSAAILLLIKWQLEILVSLGTLFYPQGNAYFVDPNCNWSSSNCVPNVNNTGFIKSMDVVIDAIFGTRGGVCSRSFESTKGCNAEVPILTFSAGVNLYKYKTVVLYSQDQGIGGITTCLCQLLNAIIPVRRDNSQPLSATNCPIIDFCCSIRHLSFGTGLLLKFNFRLLATTWQRWDFLPAGPYPSSLVSFWFCNEVAEPRTPTCGQLEPIVREFTLVVSSCFCQFFGILDQIFAVDFNGFRCFCGSGSGVLCSSGSLVYILSMQVITLLRRAPDESYWRPCGAVTSENYIVECTWSYNFLRPLLQTTCSTMASIACFINSLYSVCSYQVRMVLQSLFIYRANLVIVFLGAIEGFLRSFARLNCGDNPVGSAGDQSFGLVPSCAGMALAQLLGAYINTYIADGNIACRSGGQGRECECWQNVLPDYQYIYVDTPNSQSVSPNFPGRPPQPCVLKGFWNPQLPRSFFDQCCNGTETSVTCPSFNRTGVAPSCLPRCPTVPERCVNAYPPLPTCSNGVTGEIPVDGLFPAVFRFIRCGMLNLVPQITTPLPGFNDPPKPDVSLWDALTGFDSIIWQASLVLVSWGTNLIAWLFSLVTVYLITNIISAVLCTIVILTFQPQLCPPIIQAAGTIATIWKWGGILFTFVVAILASPIIPLNQEVPNSTATITLGRSNIPTLPPGSWNAWWNSGPRQQRVNRRMDHIRTSRNPKLASWNGFVEFMSTEQQLGDEFYVQVLLNLIWGYWTDDCMSDVRSCACRNLNMTGLCGWDNVTDAVTPESVTETQVWQYLLQKKQWTQSCEYLAGMTEHNAAEKILFGECLENRIMGERINAIMPDVPAHAVMQGWTAIPTIFSALYSKIYQEQEDIERRVIVPKDFDADPELSMKEHERKLIEFRQQLKDHMNLKRRRSLVPGTIEELTCIDQDPTTFDPLYERFSELEYKWRSGYMTRIMKRVAMNYRAITRDASFFTVAPVPSLFEITSEHAKRLGHVIGAVPYVLKIGVDATMSTLTFFYDMSPSQIWATIKAQHAKLRQRAARLPVDAETLEMRQMIGERLPMTPAYRWWYGNLSRDEDTIFTRPQMSQHMSYIYQYRKQHAENNPDDETSIFNGYGYGQRWSRLAQHLSKRWEQATRINHNAVDRVKRVYYKIYNSLYPGELTEDQHRRFIVDGDGCPLVSESVDIIATTVRYCAAKASNQTQNYTNNAIASGSTAGRYAHDLSNRIARRMQQVRNPGYDRRAFVEDLYPPHLYEWKTWSEVVGGRSVGSGRLYPRLRLQQQESEPWRNFTRHRHFRPRTAADQFSFVTWFVNTFDDIFGTNISGWLSTFFYDFQRFVLNNSTNPQDFPNVGAKYYVELILECKWPTNLDCSIGIGLEKALGYTSLGFIIAFILLPIVFPSFITILASLGVFILYLIVIGIVAWHWSPRCALLTPVFFFGYRIPFWIFPVTIAFPECLVDEVLSLFDKYITTCYDFLWPNYMVNGPVCPVCPLRMDMANCMNDVGIGDGFSNLLYIGYKLGGNTFCNAIHTVFTTVLGTWFPGAQSYIISKCDNFLQATDTQANRLNWCAWATCPIISLPVAFIVVFATFIAFVVPSLFDLVVSIWYLILASPFSILWGSQTWLFSSVGLKGDEEVEEEEGDDGDDDGEGPNDVFTRRPKQTNAFVTLGRLAQRYIIVPIAKREYSKLKKE